LYLDTNSTMSSNGVGTRFGISWLNILQRYYDYPHINTFYSTDCTQAPHPLPQPSNKSNIPIRLRLADDSTSHLATLQQMSGIPHSFTPSHRMFHRAY
jgi:hypothetical protein